jgi:hypothetical protein
MKRRRNVRKIGLEIRLIDGWGRYCLTITSFISPNSSCVSAIEYLSYYALEYHPKMKLEEIRSTRGATTRVIELECANT